MMSDFERLHFVMVMRLMLAVRRSYDAIAYVVAASHAALTEGAHAMWVQCIAALTDEQKAIVVQLEQEETVRVVIERERQQQEEKNGCARIVN